MKLPRSVAPFACIAALWSCGSAPPPRAESRVVDRALPPAPPRHAPQAPVPLAEYFRIPRVSGATFSYDERLVAYVRTGDGRT